MKAIDDALRIAQAEVGVREEGGSNLGHRVGEYQSSIGIPPGSEWCLAFVQWVLDAAGVGNILPGTGYVPSLAAWARQKGIYLTSPLAGDLVIFLDQESPPEYHVGFVTWVRQDKRTFRTVEGNSGNAVAIHEYAVSDRHRFVRWWNLVNESGPEPERTRVKQYWNGHDLALIIDGVEVYRGQTKRPGYASIILTSEAG